MRKIVNPLQYNIPIDELNDVRPLETDDIVRPSISIPVLNSLTDINGKIIKGKFAHCTPHGHLLRKNTPPLDRYQLIQYNETPSSNIIPIAFTQNVYHVIMNVINTDTIMSFIWCTPGTHAQIQSVQSETIYQLKFKGKYIHFWGNGLPFGSLVFDLYGFY